MKTVVNLKMDGSNGGMIAIATKKVLVIDDQRNARLILEGVIRCVDPFIEVKAFASPLEAIEWARISAPDLILTDYKMREIDGIETIRRLRQLQTCADVPIVMVTVSPDTVVRHAAFDAGVTDFLVKPYDHYECRARCRNLLMMHEQHLLLKDRTRLLEYEISTAVRTMRARERETIMFAAGLAEYHAHQNGYRLVRIARYSRLIAEGMNLGPDLSERIELASTLHDVGMIGIPDEVLLAAEELPGTRGNAMRQHVEIGHRLLEKSTSEYLQMAAEICLCHHERYDGLGYPRGLKGEEIPLPARIVAVAEAFDVLTAARQRDGSDRADVAMDSLTSDKCPAFDPQCVEALADHIELAREIMIAFADPA